ncbi:hypothetical protein TAMA11512_01730 [Selenomonas sp. TAMA-11512]|uniref:PrpR N-terminal domain-containing protein n=1 Tax=Selenomonas sp. TAMA-11512 TaxID=3095337 RepID=UPI003090A29B|nr:hypothetical protein TAMA11512_01730 [Selenomonas sp. TAMA-11512]
MKTLRILAVLPYAGLQNLLLQSVERYPHLKIDCFIGDMESGAALAAVHEKNDYFAILSRAGTAELIKKATHLPVVDLKISISDMLRALRLAESSHKDFAVVGFSSITRHAEVLSDIMQIPLHVVTINDIAEIPVQLKTLKKGAYPLIVGDVITTRLAKGLGFNTILVTSGQESIDAALDDVVNWHWNFQVLEERNRLYQEIVCCSSDIVFIYDNAGKNIFATESLLVEENRSLMHEIFMQESQQLQKTEETVTFHKLHDIIWRIRARKFHSSDKIYHVFYSRPFFESNKLSSNAFFYESKRAITLQLENFRSESPRYNEQIAKARTYSSSSLPLIIQGAKGVGRNSFARMVFYNSQSCAKAFLIVECAHLNERELRLLLEKADSPLTEQDYTIYFKEVDRLPEISAKKLSSYIEDTRLAKRHRLIFSCETTQPAEENRNLLFDYIKNVLNASILTIPSLNERKSDIPLLASLYINEFNSNQGRQIIGIQEDAMKLLQAFDWKYNLDQLKRVIRECVILSTGIYIKRDIVLSILQDETTNIPTGTQSPINLRQPLEKITRDILREVMREENMNQSRTAARLGISRSTLWRKLQE